MTPMRQDAGRAHRMNLWRLEWLRLTRTPRALALTALFVFFGLLEPAVARYQSEIFQHVGGGVTITFPPATPAQGISGYNSELTGVGLIVVVAIAASALTFDAHPGLATFLRTRVTNTWMLVAPRFAVHAAAAVAAYILGALAAWYETALLIGSPAVSGMLGGILCVAVYLTFALAVTVLAASLFRGTLGTVGIALAVLLLLPIAGTFEAVREWLPTTLADAPGDLLTGAHHLPHYLPTIGVAIAASAGALAIAVLRLRRREI